MLDTILSHPPDDDDEKRRLIRHHETVAERATRFAEAQRATAPEGTDVTTLVSIAAHVHDLGKAHPTFQAYLREEIDDGPSHAPLGAVAAFHAACQRGVPPTDATISLVAVARHHQRLPDASTPYAYIDDRYLDGYLDGDHVNYLGSHLDAIEDSEPSRRIAKKSYEAATDDEGSWETFATDLRDGTLAKNVENAIIKRIDFDPAVRSTRYYTTLLQTWSTLVLGDKSDAASLDSDQVTPPSNRVQSKTLEERVEQLGGDASGREATLNELRNAAFEEVNGEPLGDSDGRVHEFIERDETIATLALPTGLGKTYIGLAGALAIRDALDGSSTVIYCLPYTSIIDQTAADVEDVFGYSPTDEQFTVDHYLADTVTTLDVDNDKETDRYTRNERFLGKSWQANVVVTTFVQLFESLLGPANGRSAKLPNLTNSVVILDEPQALPLDDWDYIRDAANLLTEQYAARMLVMTATQPRIFAPDDRFDPFPLTTDSSQYFQEETERVSYTFHSSTVTDQPPLDYEDAAAAIIETLGTEAALAICNTIPSARELASTVTTRAKSAGYDHIDLNEVYDDVLTWDGANEEDINLTDVTFGAALKRVECHADPLVTLHLTTRHRPVDRERLLTLADRLTRQDVPFVFVATQLVEAGVDVSFQHVYRDFAPLDSIVQAAGRCNRNFERNRGHVTVWRLAPTSGDKSPSKAVYGSSGNDLLAVTREAIRETATLPAETVPGTRIADEAVDRYFERVRDRTEVDSSPVRDCKTGELNDYRLIDEQCLRTVEVVVCRTEADEKLANEINDLFGNWASGKAFDYLDHLSDRTVSVPIYTTDETAIERQAFFLDPAERVGTRWLVATDTSLFDARDGLTNEESVDDYLL
jgi:CRISPR-associated endonuclease Cas3-HD